MEQTVTISCVSSGDILQCIIHLISHDWFKIVFFQTWFSSVISHSFLCCSASFPSLVSVFSVSSPPVISMLCETGAGSQLEDDITMVMLLSERLREMVAWDRLRLATAHHLHACAVQSNGPSVVETHGFKCGMKRRHKASGFTTIILCTQLARKGNKGMEERRQQGGG